MVLGVGVALPIGFGLHNLRLWLAIGAAVGVVVGSAMNRLRALQDRQQDD